MKPQDIFGKKIFISPLDWGLGHCARIIPIIDLLKKNGNQIFIGVNPQQKLFFEREEKKYQLIPFDGYDFKIPKKNWELNFALQSPSLAKKLKKERLELDKLMAEHQFDIVVSDHRYGLYHSGATSVFLTHQLKLPADFFAKSINAIHQKKMLNFDFVWVCQVHNIWQCHISMNRIH